MAKVQGLTDLTNVDEDDEFKRFASAAINSIVEVVNGNLEFSNMIAQEVTVSFLSANTNVAVPHNLNKIGVRWIVTSQSDAMSIYRGSGDNNGVLYLKSSVGGGSSASLLLF